MSTDNVIPAKVADTIYDALVRFAGASESGREAFVHAQSTDFVLEYRFIGGLGFGGKFWRNTKVEYIERKLRSREVWEVSAYREDQTPERDEMIEQTNKVLAQIQKAAVGNPQ